jgi:hypothetical protein
MQAADNIPAAFLIGDDGCYESGLKSWLGDFRQFAKAKRGTGDVPFWFQRHYRGVEVRHSVVRAARGTRLSFLLWGEPGGAKRGFPRGIFPGFFRELWNPSC